MTTSPRWRSSPSRPDPSSSGVGCTPSSWPVRKIGVRPTPDENAPHRIRGRWRASVCARSPGSLRPKKVAATPSLSGTTTIRIAPFGSTCARRALWASSSSDRVKTVRVVHQGNRRAIGELEFLNPGLFQDGSRALPRALEGSKLSRLMFGERCGQPGQSRLFESGNGSFFRAHRTWRTACNRSPSERRSPISEHEPIFFSQNTEILKSK